MKLLTTTLGILLCVVSSDLTIDPVVLVHVQQKVTHHLKKDAQKRLIHKSVRCLANNIYNEARGEPFKGRVAVAYVTINRSKNRKKSICEIVHQSKIVNGKRVYQFSWLGYKHTLPINKKSYDEALKIAKLCLEHKVKDPSHGADHYHEKSINPKWADVTKETAAIGNHIFYKLNQGKHYENAWQQASL